MSGTSLAIFTSFRDDKTLGNQVILLTEAIDLAKNKASAGDVSLCSNSATAYVSGYSIVIDAVHIQINPGCNTTPTPIIYTIPQGITYNPASLTLQFNFQNYQGGQNNIIIKNTLTNKCKFVLISDTGLVTNGDVTCP